MPRLTQPSSYTNIDANPTDEIGGLLETNQGKTAYRYVANSTAGALTAGRIVYWADSAHKTVQTAVSVYGEAGVIMASLTQSTSSVTYYGYLLVRGLNANTIIADAIIVSLAMVQVADDGTQIETNVAGHRAIGQLQKADAADTDVIPVNTVRWMFE